MTNKMDSFSIDNYIVRIYRWDNDNPRRLVGVVEQVGLQGKLAFHNLDMKFVVEPGDFEIMTGPSSRDEDLQKTVLTVV